MIPWNWEEHNGKKVRVAWERQRANAKLAALKGEFVAKHRAIDCQKARMLGLDSLIKDDPGGELVSPCQPGGEGEYVVDPVASRICHGGDIVMFETQAAWRKYCSEPHDPAEFEFDSIVASLGVAPKRDGMELAMATGKETPTAPPGLTTEDVPKVRKASQRAEMSGI